ncbi:hypothetical protein D3C72_2029640 [compost metagenome]
MTGRELVFIEVGHGHGNVLFLATGVGKTEVNELDFVLLHHLHHVCNGLGHQVLLGKALVEKRICRFKSSLRASPVQASH